MKHILLSATLAIVLSVPAHAACFVEYKAKQDDPLRLHYGILELQGSCPSPAAAKTRTQNRLSKNGWSLLNILSVSPRAPTTQKQENAGDNYLRY
ncbi:hypothetical protein [Algirhabdus cladophorae]|uniref:hypothetical protein n=1 Tax=Algirhabdus cladophorae TaxID=3377108 RepID=UPI003B8494E8